MRALSGARVLRLLHAGRVLLWVLSAVFLGAALLQGRVLARLWEGRDSWTSPAEVEAEEREPGTSEPLPPVDHFAVIWEKMPPPPPPEPEPAPEPKPKPPPAPYPDMRLMGTILGGGGNYALIRVRRGTKKMLREGESFEDIRVVEVREDGATVEVKGRRKELRIAEKSEGNAR